MTIDWVKVAAIAGGIGAVAAVVLKGGEIFGKSIGFLKSIFKKKNPPDHLVPRATLVAQVEPRINALFWGKGSSGGEKPIPMMQVVADLNLTNTWSSEIKVASATLRFRMGLFRKKEVVGECLVKDTRSQYSGHYPIPKAIMTHARISFMFPWSKYPKGALYASIAVVDQFGNYHWIKGVRFKQPGNFYEGE